MLSGVYIRDANDSDIDFIIETIVRAEKGSGDKISYCRLFNISEDEFRKVLKKIIEEDINNFEFSLKSFKIAQFNGINVAAYGAWLESRDGISSGFLKINAFKAFLSKENMIRYKSTVSIVDEINIKRLPGTIQFESIYILEEFRGKNIGNLLVQALLNELIAKHPDQDIAYVQLIKQNELSLLAHQKYGFKIIEEKTTENPEIFNYFSGNTRVLMEKKIK